MTAGTAGSAPGAGPKEHFPPERPASVPGGMAAAAVGRVPEEKAGRLRLSAGQEPPHWGRQPERSYLAKLWVVRTGQPAPDPLWAAHRDQRWEGIIGTGQGAARQLWRRSQPAGGRRGICAGAQSVCAVLCLGAMRH